MITLNQLIKETGINRHTLAKYRDLGLIPKPQIVHRGYKKEGEARGNEALYPSYTPWLLEKIRNLKMKPYEYSISQIREEIGKVEEITPDEEISEPLQSNGMHDIIEASLRISSRLDNKAPNYRRILVEYEADEKDGKLKVEAIWGIKQR
jgi:hypothetical protein